MLLLAAAALGLLVQPAMAFQEGNKQEGGAPAQERPAAAVSGPETPKAVEPGKGLSFRTPELSIGQGTGTEVRIPGIGKVGVLPRLDFGLELLYGATEAKGIPEERTEPPADVQIRGTIKHRF
jgi:hypothetical protein